jgi:hypothetical protein
MTTQVVAPNDLFCRTCNVPCGTDRAYKNHLRSNIHRLTIGLPPLEHRCPGCQKSFSRQSEVKRHRENGKCSVSRTHLVAEVDIATKHGLSVSPDTVAWKYRRTSSPDHALADDLPQHLIPKRESADDSNRDGLLDSDFVYQSAPVAMPSIASPRTEQLSSEGSLSLEDTTSTSTHNTTSPTSKTSETESSQQRSGTPPIEEPHNEVPPQEQQALPAQVATTASNAMTIVRTGAPLDVFALAESMDTLSFQEFTELKSKIGRKQTEALGTSYRASPKSYSLRSLGSSSVEPDSLGGLFGLAENPWLPSDFVNWSPASRMRPSSNEIQTTTKAFSNEQPVSAQGAYDKHEVNGRRLLQQHGHHDSSDSIPTRETEVSYTQLGNPGNLESTLQTASFKGQTKIVQLLLQKSVNINAQGGEYGNALCAASLGGHKETVQLLLNKGANVNARGGLFGNALQDASRKGQTKTVQLLLNNGANINAQGGEYGNALCAASLGRHKETVQLLLNKGANVNAQGGKYGNALQAAFEADHAEIVQLLLDKGADMPSPSEQLQLLQHDVRRR